MYQAFWRFRVKPFRSPVDAEPWIALEGHAAALNKLRYALDEGLPLALLSGPSGIGKTHLLSALKKKMHRRVGPWFTLPTCLPAEAELLAWIADLITEQPAGAQGSEVGLSFRRIAQRIAELQQLEIGAVLVLESAHLLIHRGTLELVRQIVDLQTGRPALTIILCGDDWFAEALGDYPSVEQRCAVKASMEPLTLEQTSEYLRGQLAFAGVNREIFDPSAIETIQQFSRGIPRLINRLADLALLIGYAENAQSINANHIQGVQEELLCGLT